MVETTIDGVASHVNTSLHPRQTDVERTASELDERIATLARIRAARVKEGGSQFWNWWWSMATDPGLTISEKWHATVLSAYADYSTGENCSPVREDVMALTGLKERMVQEHMRHFKNLEMISSNKPGRGRPLVSKLLSPVADGVAAGYHPIESLGSSRLPPYKSLGGNGATSLGGNGAHPSLPTHLPTQIDEIDGSEKAAFPGKSPHPEVVVAPQRQTPDDRPPKTTKTKTSPSPAVPENDSKEHLAWLKASLAEYGAVVNCVSIKHELFTIDLLQTHMAGTLAGLPKAESDEIVLSHALRWASGMVEPARTPSGFLAKVIKNWKLEKDVNGQITREALASARHATNGGRKAAADGRYAVVNGMKRFRDEARLPRVQFHGLAGEDGNRILDAVPGATTEIVMRAIEDAGRRAAKDVSFGDVIGFCIEWCEKRVGGQNDE